MLIGIGGCCIYATTGPCPQVETFWASTQTRATRIRKYAYTHTHTCAQVVVYTGLLELLGSEEELASVLAHGQ